MSQREGYSDLPYAAYLLKEARKKMAYEALLYGKFAEDEKGLDAHIWQGKSVAMNEAFKATEELWHLLADYQEKQPVLKLVKAKELAAKEPEKKALRSMKSGVKPQLSVVK